MKSPPFLVPYDDYLYQGSAKIAEGGNTGLFTKDVLGKFDEYLRWKHQGQKTKGDVDKLRVWNQLLADEYHFFKGGENLDDLVKVYKRMKLADFDHMGAGYWDRIIKDTIAAKTKIQPPKP